MFNAPLATTSQPHKARTRQLPLETPSLKLRSLVSEDATKIFRMSQEEGMRAWLPSQVYRDEAHAASVLAFLISQYGVPADPKVGPYVLGVQLRSSGELVGHVGLSPLGQAVEVGFAIENSHQRKGIATEAVRAACHWAGDVFSLETILGITAAQNVASQGVLLRAGFTRQKDEVIRFQGLEQPVIFFAFSRQHERMSPGRPNPAFERTRRFGLSTWRALARRAAQLGR
jgi:[ribosomal protein S5]-alanine N-acetyltransferase